VQPAATERACEQERGHHPVRTKAKDGSQVRRPISSEMPSAKDPSAWGELRSSSVRCVRRLVGWI